MMRTRSKSREHGKRGDSRDSHDSSENSDSNSPTTRKGRRLKSVIAKRVEIPQRNQSSSRERRPKKCTVCDNCDGHHDNAPRAVMEDAQDCDVSGEPLDYEDDLQEMSPVQVEEIHEDVDQSHEAEPDQEGALSDHDGDADDVNNNAGTDTEVRASIKYTRKRKTGNNQVKPNKSRRVDQSERQSTDQQDVNSSVQTVLSNPEAIAKIMKECAPVFARAMQEAAASTSQGTETISPLQAVERSRAGESNGNATEVINKDLMNLALRSDRNGAVLVTKNPTLSEATIYTRACEQMTPPDERSSPDELTSPEGDRQDSDNSMVVPADDDIEFNFAGRQSQPTHPPGQQPGDRTAPVFDPKKETRKRAQARANVVVQEAENAKTTLLKPPS